MTAPTLAGVCRADRPAHPITRDDMLRINHQLTVDDIPVTAKLDGPDGVILLHCALTPTTRQVAHTLHIVRRITDAPLHWAGAL